MPKLKAEEELLARAAAAHPHLKPEDQRAQFSRLLSAIGRDQPVKKATYADLRSIGIKVKEPDGDTR
jgi:hypothetical protein